jgi:hypothetical protein
MGNLVESEWNHKMDWRMLHDFCTCKLQQITPSLVMADHGNAEQDYSTTPKT